jgi:peptide/nickel transport system substrate-binding protein
MPVPFQFLNNYKETTMQGCKQTQQARSFAIGAALAVFAGGVAAQAEQPKYGGTLQLGVSVGVLTWDMADWNAAQNHDAGPFYEPLLVGDLAKSKRHGGLHAFTSEAWVPSDAVKGELAESWKWTNPLTLEIKLRKGVKFPAKPGVMAERELVADDVVFSFNRMNSSPKRTPNYYDYLEKVEATGQHTVTLKFKQYHTEWDYRFGWGYYSGIMPKEVAAAGAANWKNLNGTGPFQLVDYVQGNSSTYARNPIYWGKEKIGGKEYKLPFIDTLVFRTIKDETTQHAALRTGKLDILENIRWQAVDELKKNAPQLKWLRRVSLGTPSLVMRVDTKPFNDIRVRRALNMAVDKRSIVKDYYKGNAKLLNYPQPDEYIGYYEALEAMPAAVQELFTYNPEKAKKLLAEAGYPKGFSFKVQVCSCSFENSELLPLVAAYLDQVGVKLEIQVMEQAAFLSAMTSKKNAPGYFFTSSSTTPTTAIRKSFVTGQVWNPSQYSDPAIDKAMDEIHLERDEQTRQRKLKLVTRDILEKAPYIWLPTPYAYSAWWPWVKNYGGELGVGAARAAPIYARVWVDQEMKKKMGF